METTSLLPPSTSLDTMASPSEAINFLKLEDFHSSPPPRTSSFHDITSQCSPPAPVIVHLKPAKKRKSWGQELPAPKTNLPPRKRAKTDDEKEQRRIERIKRNRAAAHNSRERKRQETDTLAVALARANAELDAYRRLHGPLPSTVLLPDVTLSTDSADTPAPSLVESRSSFDAPASPASATSDLYDYDGDYAVSIKQEPSDAAFPSMLPPPFEALDAKSALSPLDPTQHSAAMLCDLQCRSSRVSRSNHNSKASTSSTASRWATFFLHLMTLQLQISSKTLLLALWTLSPSRTARLMQASARRLTSPSTTSSTTPRLSMLTAALAQRNAATSLVRRQGALVALQRRRVGEALRVRGRAVARRRHQTGTDTKALEENRERELDHQDENGGVGR